MCLVIFKFFSLSEKINLNIFCDSNSFGLAHYSWAKQNLMIEYTVKVARMLNIFPELADFNKQKSLSDFYQNI